jgi:folylpolyglutamate synthase/dihydropteroate synthase
VRADHPLLITGSIYLAGEARQLMMERFGVSPPTF